MFANLRMPGRSMNADAVPASAAWPGEIHRYIPSFEAWQDFYAAARYINDPSYLEFLVDQVRRDGFACPYTGERVAPRDIKFNRPNYREGLLHGGLNSRHRAVLREFLRHFQYHDQAGLRVYAPEAVTPFALLLRGRYPRFIGSEYTEDAAARAALFPIPCESLLDLSFPDDAFDAVLVNDVFEHVPDLIRSLVELARVTRPGGRLISTFPFNIGGRDSVVKARLGPAGIEYLTEPEYHGNPVDPKGSLVFTIPGWEILEQSRAAGWRDAVIAYETSATHGIVGGGFSGIFTLVAER